LLVSESGFDWACTCVGALTASPSIKATARAIASIFNRDERLNLAMSKILVKSRSFYKDGRYRSLMAKY
jgi:hypothetical protein